MNIGSTDRDTAYHGLEPEYPPHSKVGAAMGIEPWEPCYSLCTFLKLPPNGIANSPLNCRRGVNLVIILLSQYKETILRGWFLRL